MKILICLLLLSVGFSYAADKVAEKPSPIIISAPKALATYNQETGKITYEKGESSEHVAEVLMGELMNLGKNYQVLKQECDKKIDPPKSVKKK